MITEAVDGTATAIEKELEELPPHLLGLPRSAWAIWRCVGLRGSGFPANEVLKLADADCAAAADKVLEAESDARRARSRAIESLRATLARGGGTPCERAEIEKAIRRLQKDKLPQAHNLSDDGAGKAFREAVERVDRWRTAFLREFEASVGRTSLKICEVASDSRFREAVIWQNREAYRTGIKRFVRSTPEAGARNTKLRQSEELVATYLQRYSVKNDTIGFFGPVGWAWLMPTGDAVRVRPGPELLRTRTVYFEGWCIDAVAEMLSQNKRLRRWFAPLPMPFVYTEGNTVHLPFQKPFKLSAEQAAVFHRCDGSRQAREIASDVVADPSNNLLEQDVYRLLEALRIRGLISWSLSVALPYRQHPEQTLKEFCERIDEQELRRPVAGLIEELESARRAVERASNDPDALDNALATAEEVFTRITGLAPTRSAGQMYASRTLLYEDCRRDVEVELGPEHLVQLGRPLALLLDSARWFTYQVTTHCREAFNELYDELALKNRSPIVSALDFWDRAQPLLFDSGQRIATRVLPEFQRRWAEILQFSAERRVAYQSEEMREAVQATFSAPRAGWRFARYHSPDVMIDATDVDAIRRGDFQYVLGELHLGHHTMSNWIFVGQHPAPEYLLRAAAADLPEPRVVFVIPKHWPAVNVRTSTALTNPKDFYLRYSVDPVNAPPSQTLPIGSLELERRGQELLMRTRDGRLEFDLVEMFGETLSGVGINYFKLFPEQAHTPRVTIDRLVVSRETWRFTSSELQFASEKGAPQRFLSARRWAWSHGMPRFVFVKTPVEVKPFFVDFESPLYVDIFAKMVRRTVNAEQIDPVLDEKANALISVSEMLPTPSQTWLGDARERKYTSEFRIIAVDLAR